MSSVFSSQDQFCPFWDQFCRFAYIIRLGDHFCLGITFASGSLLRSYKADVGLSFASSNISLDLHNKSNVRLGAVQQVYIIISHIFITHYIIS